MNREEEYKAQMSNLCEKYKRILLNGLSEDNSELNSEMNSDEEDAFNLFIKEVNSIKNEIKELKLRITELERKLK